jgi:hypothetical protein
MGGEQSVPSTYRSASKRTRDESEAVEEALELMRIQSHEELQRKQVRYLSFKPTWAKLAEYCVKWLSSAILTLQSDSDLIDAVHVAHDLRDRLNQRDASEKGRVTKETREAIHNASGVAIVLHLLLRIKDGKVAPSFENAGLASTLRHRFGRIGEVPDYVSSLVRDAVGRALTGDASEGVKIAWSRVLVQWTPQEEKDDKPRGTRVSFDSHEDFQFL